MHDIGCGYGASVHQMRCVGIDASGSDISKNCIDVAKEKGLDVWHGEFDDLMARKGRKVHIATMMHLLEHCIDPVGFLEWDR